MSLRTLRKAQKISITKLSKRLEISQCYLSKIELGHKNPSNKILHKILTKGLNIQNSQTNYIIAEWRIEKYINKMPKELAKRLLMKFYNKLKDN